MAFTGDWAAPDGAVVGEEVDVDVDGAEEDEDEDGSARCCSSETAPTRCSSCCTVLSAIPLVTLASLRASPSGSERDVSWVAATAPDYIAHSELDRSPPPIITGHSRRALFYLKRLKLVPGLAAVELKVRVHLARLEVDRASISIQSGGHVTLLLPRQSKQTPSRLVRIDYSRPSRAIA